MRVLNMLNVQQMLKRKREIAHPRTVDEAKVLLNRAIENGDFEVAEMMHDDLTELQNFEDEMNLGQIVTGYFYDNQALSNQFQTNCEKVEKKVDKTVAKADAIYQRKFRAKKRRQMREMNELFEEWQAAREGALDEAETIYEEAMQTAKIIARDGRFKDAAKMKDHAMRAKILRCSHSNTHIDEHYESLVQLMTKRHYSELQQLVMQRNQEMRDLKVMRHATQDNAMNVFHVANAENIVNIARSFTPDCRMPLSLRMQTIHANPVPAEDGAVSGPDPAFDQKMLELDATLLNTCPLSSVKSPISGRKKTSDRIIDRRRRMVQTPK